MNVNGKEHPPKTSATPTDTTTEQHTTDGAQPSQPMSGGHQDNAPAQHQAPRSDDGRPNYANHPPYQVPTEALQHNGMHAPSPPLYGYPTAVQQQAPNSVQYPYPIPAYVSQQAMTGEHMPQDADSDPAQPQKQQRKRGMTRTQLIQEMVNHLSQNYVLIQDSSGACFLQGRFNYTLHSISTDTFYVPMKTYAMNIYGKELTDSMIRSVIDIFCGNQTQTIRPIVSVHCGRTLKMLGNALYYYQRSDSYIALSYNPETGAFYCQTQALPLLLNRSARPAPAHIGNIHPSTLENLFRGYSVPEGEYLVLITWMISALISPSGAFLLELIDDDNQRVQKIQRDLKQLIDACTQDFIPEVPTRRQQFDTLALDHYLLNFSPVDELSLPAQKNLLDLLNGYTVDVGLKPKRHSYSVFIQRPILLSADESVITHGPLLDRAITLHLSRATSPVNVDMSISFSAYFSAWLNLAAYVNHHLQPMLLQHATGSNHTPADFFRQIGILVCQVLGKDEQLFLQEMAHQASTRQELTLSESPVAQVLIAYLDAKAIASESKSAIDWLDALNAFSPELARETGWPATPRALGAAFKQAKAVLDDAGIECVGEKRGSFRVWTVQRQHDVTDDSNE